MARDTLANLSGKKDMTKLDRQKKVTALQTKKYRDIPTRRWESRIYGTAGTQESILVVAILERAVNIDYRNIKNGNIKFILTSKREHQI